MYCHQLLVIYFVIIMRTKMSSQFIRIKIEEFFYTNTLAPRHTTTYLFVLLIFFYCYSGQLNRMELEFGWMDELFNNIK